MEGISDTDGKQSEKQTNKQTKAVKKKKKTDK